MDLKNFDQSEVNTEIKLKDIFDYVTALSDGEKYLLVGHLRQKLSTLVPIWTRLSDIANNATKVKNLLLMKKEMAIEDLLVYLPYLKPQNTLVKMAYLKVMPVLFSHVSLYDVRIQEVLKIVEVLRLHPAFVPQQSLFVQWYTMFQARRQCKKHFSFKDENYVRDLPELSYSFSDDTLTRSVAYSNISLLRAFHRWLRLHRLHKYLYFFANLSYEEILDLDERNFDHYQERVNLHLITVGAKNKILREIEILRERPKCLEEILKTQFRCHQSVEDAVRDIKRILRSPICVNDHRQENLPQLLLKALNKVFLFVLEQAEINEKMIPIYGLLISICKEAWNYTIFNAEERNRFNGWRQQISKKAGQNYYDPALNNTTGTLFVDDMNYCKLSIQEQSAGNSYYQCLEDIATGCANYILK